MQLTTTAREALLRAFYTHLFDSHTSAGTPERLAAIACLNDDQLVHTVRQAALRSSALRRALEIAMVPLTKADLTVTIGAKYELNGLSPEAVRTHVEAAFKDALRGGILTGALDCFVDWTLAVDMGVGRS